MMRQIVVDVGNTSTAVGLWTDGRVSHVAHCDGGFDEASRFAAELAQSIARSKPFRQSGKSNPLSDSRISLAYVSVVPKADRLWKTFAKQSGFSFRQVTSTDFSRSAVRQAKQTSRRPNKSNDSQTITLDYPRPETIGADRLADAAGAVSRYGAPVLVMDFGTALTAAVVTRDRVWRGGVIAPGFPLMRDYLFERTAKLPRMELGKGKPPKIGRSTEEAMRFGALIGYRGMVREIVAELGKNFKEDFRLVATGGFARWALKDIGLPFTIDPNLTLYGAGLICSGKQ